MALVVGEKVTLTGDVTKLGANGAKAPQGVEDMLGFGRGRLSRGYYICLLAEALTPGDFEMSGTTLRSGGKLGLPRATAEEDDRRSRVSSQIRYEYGDDGYDGLKMAALNRVTATGADRLVKFVPVTRHAPGLSPADQYPMGGGSLQWTLLPPGKLFYVAAFVDALGMAETAAFKASVAPDAAYDNRAKLARYLADVTV